MTTSFAPPNKSLEEKILGGVTPSGAQDGFGGGLLGAVFIDLVDWAGSSKALSFPCFFEKGLVNGLDGDIISLLRLILKCLVASHGHLRSIASQRELRSPLRG